MVGSFWGPCHWLTCQVGVVNKSCKPAPSPSRTAAVCPWDDHGLAAVAARVAQPAVMARFHQGVAEEEKKK